jgi:hypothetical protein
VWRNKDQATVTLLAGADAVSKTHRGSRDLDFAPEDSKSERGRAIGLVIAELLRSSPAWAWSRSAKGDAAVQPGVGEPLYADAGAAFASERAMSGEWASGPALAFGLNLSEAFQLRAEGAFLIGSRNQYREAGLRVGANWDFLRLASHRFALGVCLLAGFSHESLTIAGDDGKSTAPTQWNGTVGASLRARVALWRSLGLVAEGGIRAQSGNMSGTFGDDDHKSKYDYSRWRPGFALGLDLAM